MEAERTFKIAVSENAADKERRRIFDENVSRYDAAVKQAKVQYSDLELARKRAGYIRAKSINGLEKYLIEFEANMDSNGGKVLWAQNAEEANSLILKVLKKCRVTKINRSFSLLADEIKIDEALDAAGISAVKVSPGEYILSMFDEDPRHPSSLLISKTFSDIKAVLQQKEQIAPKHNALEIVEFIRKKFRPVFQSNVASITGANFIIADTGSVCLSENSGDAALNSVIPDIQIILAGIDKVIPSIINLDTLLPLYATYSSGQRMNAFNTILSGPGKEGEKDGPRELYVILIDNGRSEVLSQKFQRRALSCIDCGACHNACPVYRIIGGQSYGTTYTGPIGSIITPWMKGPEEFMHLSYASVSCGKYNDVCPVAINLNEQILHNRNDSVKMGNHNFLEKIKMEGWSKYLRSRKWMDWKPIWKNIILKRSYPGKLLGTGVTINEVNFKQLWEERREGITRK